MLFILFISFNNLLLFIILLVIIIIYYCFLEPALFEILINSYITLKAQYTAEWIYFLLTLFYSLTISCIYNNKICILIPIFTLPTPYLSPPLCLLPNSGFPPLYICNDPLSPIINVTICICIGSSPVIGSSMKDEYVFLPPQLWPLRSFSVKDGAYRVPSLQSPCLYWLDPVPVLCRLPQRLWIHAWDGHVLARRQQSRVLLHTLWLSRPPISLPLMLPNPW